MKPYTLLWAGLLLFSTVTLALENTSSKQVDEVQQRKTVHGGVQHVVVKSADNTQQIKLIQENLLKMANDFRKGDFSVTEHIHGATMPGLAQLKKAETDDIKYEFKALPNGAQIHYSTEYPQYVQALHEWFDAQMSEHGNEAVPEHSKHHSTVAE
ncbi:MAG: aspartate carbamoyltransferase [Methylococcaceae bacterium]|nr:aspartate carbamoyltransferase [Methylococcaceae bacterium]